MHTTIIIRKKTTRICTVLGICSFGLYTTACDSGELPGKEKEKATAELRFTASISDSPSIKSNHGSDIIETTAFPDGTHAFGMFVTREGGGALVTGSGDNMKLTLTKSAGSPDTWSQTDKNDGNLSLIAKHGESIDLTGYYPWTAAASASSVPFDLSGNMSDCTDLLYLSSPAGAQPVYDGTPVALNFSHAYCWVTVKLSKLIQKTDVFVKSVSIENSSGNLKRIVNKGAIDPKTGDLISNRATSGPLVVDCAAAPVDLPLSNTAIDPAVFNFLVPPFMATDVQDSDIVIRVTTNVSGADEVLSFPLNRVHLNNITNQYGFAKGMHNTYTIVYNNAAMILSLSNWQGVGIGDGNLGGTIGETPIEVSWTNNHNGLIPAADRVNLKKLDLADHRFHTYLGEVAENNNGAYVTLGAPSGTTSTVWTPVVTADYFYTKLKVARNNAAGGGDVPWKDKETGALLAKQACAEFREGGYTDWRLPRISEFFMIIYPAKGILIQGDYWSATEHSADECYYITSSVPVETTASWIPQHTSKAAGMYVRCVRDSDKPRGTI